VILRAGNGMGQVSQSEFVKARQKFIFVLLTKQPKHPVVDGLFRLFYGNHELHAQEELMVQFSLGGDRFWVQRC